MADKNQDQSRDGFVEFDPAIFEGSPFADDFPFAKAEVDQPAGFIKIEPPLDMSDFTEQKPIELKSEMDSKEKESKEKKPKEKESVTKKLKAQKDKSVKEAATKKTNQKNLGEAI